MSDNADGAKRNVNSVHQKRSLFQVSNPFWPPVSHDSLLSTNSSTRAFRRRDGPSQYSEQTESFVVDIPVHDENGDANNSTARSVTSDTEGSGAESGSGSASPSSGEELDTSANNSFLTLGSSDEATSGDSTDERRLLLPETGYDSDTSDFTDEDTDTDTDVETTSVGNEVDSTAISDRLADTSTGDEVDSTSLIDETEITSLAGEKEITSAVEQVGSISIGVEVDESGNYSSSYYDSSNNASSDDEQYSDEENVNINAKKEGGDAKKGKDGKESGGDDKKKKGGNKKGSKKSKGPGKKGDKKGGKDKKKGKPPKEKTNGDKEGKKTQQNNFFNIFSTDSPYPPSVYFILGSEFCERFTYYGLRSILVMYLTSWLGIARNDATACFHIFSCLAYSSPIIGAIIADGHLGRYRTILYVSVVYTLGCVILAISSFPPPQFFGPMLGLFLISVGTGGIKPCVVTFGGDQFPPDQMRRRATFFSTFYFIINIGSMLSTIITPVLRSDVHCVDQSCYPLAFGVPAILMTMASLVFWAGQGNYKHVEPSGSLFSKTMNCICYAMCGCCGGVSGPKKPEGKPKDKKGKKGDSKKKGKGKGKEKGKGKGKGKGKDKGGGKKPPNKKDDKNKNALSSEEDTNENKAKEAEKKEGDKDAKDKGDKGDKKKTKGGKKDSKKGKKGAKKGGKKEKDKKAKKGPPPKKNGDGKHWLDRAAGPFEPTFIEDVKRLTKLVWLFLPLPLFWALFNQQGSRWTLQAAQLDGRIGDFGRLKPDQMQALNPLFIILLIPVFERVVYPCINSCGIPNRALQRMVVGMMCSAGAFLLAAILQSKIDSLNEDPLVENNSGYTIINTVHCKIWCRGDPTPFFEGNIGPFGQTEFQRVASGVKTVQVMCPTMGTQGWTQATLSERKASRLVITSVSGVMSILVLDDKRDKSTNGTGYVSFLHLLAWVDEATIRVTSVRDDSTPMVLKVGLSKATEFHVLEPGSYQIAFPAMNNPMEAKSTKAGEWQDVGKPFEIGSGGVYTIAMIDPTNNIDLHEVLVEKYVTVKENSLSMMLMIPQYIAITVGEILFSISGLAFAYTQAPESMKSVIQACWLLTTSVGDLIVVLVAELDLLPSQMAEFYLFSAVMMADCVIFAIMTCFYSYVESETTMTTKKPGGSKKGDKKGGKKGDKKGGKKGDKKGGKKGGKKDSKKKKGGKEGDGKEGGGEDKKKGGSEKK